MGHGFPVGLIQQLIMLCGSKAFLNKNLIGGRGCLYHIYKDKYDRILIAFSHWIKLILQKRGVTKGKFFL